MFEERSFVFGLIAFVAVAMASNRIRFDMVALLVVLALMLSGVLTVGEAVAGFGSPVVILVAGLLVVGEMLDRTGVARAMGDWIIKQGGASETKLLVVIMLGAGLLGAIMSSTAVVAIFIPIVLRIAAETRINASRLLMPMSYAALISGMLTLIATPPNLVVSEELYNSGYQAFRFFSFTPVGLGILIVAIGYMLLVGRRLLAAGEEPAASRQRGRPLQALRDEYSIGAAVDALKVPKNSPIQGKTIGEAALESEYGVRVLGLLRRDGRSESRVPAPSSDKELRPNDELLVIGRPEDQERLIGDAGLLRVPITRPYRRRWFWEAGGVVVLIHPDSSLVGKSLRDTEFRTTYNLHVLGVRRGKEALENHEDTKLAVSDSLFVVGSWKKIQKLQSLNHEFIVLEMPAEHEDIAPAFRRMPLALTILTGMVTLSIFDVIPLVAAVMLAVVLAVATRCLTMEDAYRSIHWSSIVLIAGMLPLADALQKTGGTDLIVGSLLTALGDAGPSTMLTVIFFLTAALGLFLSNTASAVLVAPIAIIAAEKLSISPYPLAVAVVVAASAAFVTPVSTPVVTLVVDPGRYKFMDFVKIGVPLLLLAYLVTLLVAPLIFPFERL
jgi:di/tricarboxylate transporter